MRYASLTDPAVLETEKELFIRITPDEGSSVLSVRDSGVGSKSARLSPLANGGFRD